MANSCGSGSGKGAAGGGASAQNTTAISPTSTEFENKVMSDINAILDQDEGQTEITDYSTLLTNANAQEFNGNSDPGAAAYTKFAANQDANILKTSKMSEDQYSSNRWALTQNGAITGALRRGEIDDKGNILNDHGNADYRDLLKTDVSGMKKIDKLYKNATLSSDVITFRGINGDKETLKALGLDKPLNKLIGTKMVDKGYSCQTTSLSIARGYIESDSKVLIVNKIKAGQKALNWDNGDYAGIGRNEQITPNRGSSFVIKNAYKKGGYLVIQTETEQ